MAKKQSIESMDGSGMMAASKKSKSKGKKWFFLIDLYIGVSF